MPSTISGPGIKINPPDKSGNPLTKTGKKVMTSMTKQYGAKKGKQVFYASINAKKPGSKGWHR